MTPSPPGSTFPAPSRPGVALVGGNRLHTRLSFATRLSRDYRIMAVAPTDRAVEAFRAQGFTAMKYELARGFSPLSDLKSLRQLKEILHSLRPEMVHAFETKPSVFGRLAARWAGIPHILGTMTGLGTAFASEGPSAAAARTVLTSLHRLAAPGTGALVFQNPEDRAFFVEQGLIEAPRAVVIPGSGIETDHFRPDAVPDAEVEALRRRLGIDPGARIVVGVMRLTRAKGAAAFAEVARLFREPGFSPEGNRRDVTVKDPTPSAFVLVGRHDPGLPGSLLREEVERVQALTTWVGEVEDVRPYLALADAFLYPSVYREGIPRTLMEAACMELPVVAVDVRGVREVVESGVTGSLVGEQDPRVLARCLTELLGDPTVAREMGRRGRERVVQRFGLEAIATQYLALYRRLLDGRSLPVEAA